jgi:hypothetical protein
MVILSIKTVFCNVIGERLERRGSRELKRKRLCMLCKPEGNFLLCFSTSELYEDLLSVCVFCHVFLIIFPPV